MIEHKMRAALSRHLPSRWYYAPGYLYSESRAQIEKEKEKKKKEREREEKTLYQKNPCFLQDILRRERHLVSAVVHYLNPL